MKIKDVLILILSSLAVAAIAILVMTADSMPMTVLLAIAAVIWVLLFVFMIRDAVNRRKKTLYVKINGEWIAIPPDARRYPENRRYNRLFDQDEEKELV